MYIFRPQAILKEKRSKSSSKPIEITEMISITEHLTDVFESAIASAYPSLQNAPTVISQSSNPKFGDYQCNSSMPIAKLLGNKGNLLIFYFKIKL